VSKRIDLDLPPEVPNLDDEQSARAFAKYPPSRLQRHYRISERTAHALNMYARLRLSAHESRLRGDINHAIRVEDRMEKLYQELPASVRW
jgi:hypothetical protein